MSVILTGEKNVAFVHIPKTAGTSITKWLTEHKGNSNLEYFENHPSYNDLMKDRNDLFTFTVVRNPYERVVSLYHFIRNVIIPKFPNTPFLTMNNIESENTFPSFNDWVLDLDNMKYPEHMWYTIFTSQSVWNNPNINLTIRYENLDESFVEVQKYLNIPYPLPKFFVSGHTHYRDYYTDETRKLIGLRCERDLDELKYTF